MVLWKKDYDIVWNSYFNFNNEGNTTLRIYNDDKCNKRNSLVLFSGGYGNLNARREFQWHIHIYNKMFIKVMPTYLYNYCISALNISWLIKHDAFRNAVLYSVDAFRL